MSELVCMGLTCGAAPVAAAMASATARYSALSSATSAPETPETQVTSGGCSRSQSSADAHARMAASTSARTSASASVGGKLMAAPSSALVGTELSLPAALHTSEDTITEVDRPAAACIVGWCA